MLVTLTAGCFLLALGAAHPHHLQQVYYPQQPATFYYHHPQADAASVTSVQRYANSVPVGVSAPGAPQYVLLYPGGPQHNFLTGRADGTELITERPTIWNFFNLFNRPTTTPAPASAPPSPDVEDAVTEAAAAAPEATPTKAAPTPTSTAATTVEETTPKPVNEELPKPEKITNEDGTIMMAVEVAVPQTTDEEKAPLENLDETVQPDGSTSSDGRQFVLVQRPQFFGNYDLLRQPGMQQRFGVPPGAVSDFLLLRNGFATPGAVAAPGRPLKLEAAQTQSFPGAAALAFQEEMRRRDVVERGLPKPQLDVSRVVLPHGGFLNQNVFLVGAAASPSGAVVVDADRPKADASGTEQAGPSVAQAKPQAIAVAGVGGMAAATPVATAIVGPGGLAVSAPMATAVAGHGGGETLLGPAQAAITAANKNINKVNKIKVKDDGYQRYR